MRLYASLSSILKKFHGCQLSILCSRVKKTTTNHLEFNRCINMNSWDRFLVRKPSHLVKTTAAYGNEPIRIGPAGLGPPHRRGTGNQHAITDWMHWHQPPLDRVSARWAPTAQPIMHHRIWPPGTAARYVQAAFVIFTCKRRVAWRLAWRLSDRPLTASLGHSRSTPTAISSLAFVTARNAHGKNDQTCNI